MKHRSIPAILTTAVVAIPAGAVWAATHQAPQAPTSSATARATATPSPRGKSKSKPVHHASTSTATYRYTGPSVDMQWGPVQVTIVVKNKKIADVQATAPTERSRSAFINSQAIPWLRQETLQAQSANIDEISGATMTSDAFAESLQAALDQAHKAHTI